MFGHDIKRSTNLGLKFGIFFGNLSCGLFGLNKMIRSLTKSRSMNSNLRTSFCKNTLSIANSPGNKPSNALRDAIWRSPLLLRDLTRLGGHIASYPPPRTHGFLELENHGQYTALAWGVGGLNAPSLRFAIHGVVRLNCGFG